MLCRPALYWKKGNIIVKHIPDVTSKITFTSVHSYIHVLAASDVLWDTCKLHTNTKRTPSLTAMCYICCTFARENVR